MEERYVSEEWGNREKSASGGSEMYLSVKIRVCIVRTFPTRRVNASRRRGKKSEGERMEREKGGYRGKRKKEIKCK